MTYSTNTAKLYRAELHRIIIEINQSTFSENLNIEQKYT